MHTKMEMRSYEWGFGHLGIWAFGAHPSSSGLQKPNFAVINDCFMIIPLN